MRCMGTYKENKKTLEVQIYLMAKNKLLLSRIFLMQLVSTIFMFINCCVNAIN